MAVSHGDADAVAVGDYHLKNVVAWHLLEGRPRGTDEEMMELLEPFRPPSRQSGETVGKGGPGRRRFGPRYAATRFSISAELLARKETIASPTT